MDGETLPNQITGANAGRATSVADADALGRPRRSVESLGVIEHAMTFPQPPWNLFGCFRESEHERLLAELKSSGIKHQIKHDPNEAKPYQLWIHDDDLQLAADTLFRHSK